MSERGYPLGGRRMLHPHGWFPSRDAEEPLAGPMPPRGVGPGFNITPPGRGSSMNTTEALALCDSTREELAVLAATLESAKSIAEGEVANLSAALTAVNGLEEPMQALQSLAERLEPEITAAAGIIEMISQITGRR